MNHRKGNKKLNKPTDQRVALLRSLTLALFENQKIKTTDVRAQAAKAYAEKIITLGINGDLSSVRKAMKMLPNRSAIKKIFSLSSKYSETNGGYIRLTKVGFRKGDAAPVSLLELA